MKKLHGGKKKAVGLRIIGETDVTNEKYIELYLHKQHLRRLASISALALYMAFMVFGMISATRKARNNVPVITTTDEKTEVQNG